MAPRNVRLAGVLMLWAALAAVPKPAYAGWTGNGAGVAVKPGAQSRPSVVADGAGGAYVGWVDGAIGAFTLTHLDANGDPVQHWGADGIPVAGLGPFPGFVLVADGSGGALFMVVSGEATVYHVGPDTTIAPGFTVGGCGFRLLGSAPGDGGSLLFAYHQIICANTSFLTTGRAGPTGARTWSQTVATSLLDLAGPRVPTALASDFARGSYLLTRRDTLDFTTGPPRHPVFFVNRIDSTGANAAGWLVVGRVITPGDSLTANPLLVSDPSSGAIALWSDHSAGGDRLLGQWIAPDGTATSTIPLTDFDSRRTNLLAAADGSGGAFVIWSDTLLSSSAVRVMALHVDAAGSVDHGPTALTLAAHAPAPQALAADGAGGVYAAWTDDPLGDGVQRVFVSRLTAALDPAAGWSPGGLSVCDAPGGQDQASLTVVDGSAVVAWRDLRGTATGTDADIYAAKITPDGVVPVLFSLVDAFTRDGVVRVRWQSDGGPPTARVERSADGSEWEDVGTVARDGLGIYTFVDAAVSPGSRWFYRLVSPTGEVLTSIVSVFVPSGSALALSGFVAENGPPTVALTLATAAPARLDIYDALGRRQLGVDIAGLSAGEQRVRLDAQLRAGLYFLRLTQSGAQATRRSVRLE